MPVLTKKKNKPKTNHPKKWSKQNPPPPSRNLVLMELYGHTKRSMILLLAHWSNAEILSHFVKRTADGLPLDTWVIFPSYEKRFWSPWVHTVNFYFSSLTAKFWKFMGFPSHLVKLLSTSVWTQMPVYMVCTDQQMCINAYTRLQTSCFQLFADRIQTIQASAGS